jgi:hypothetical protein
VGTRPLVNAAVVGVPGQFAARFVETGFHNLFHRS